MFVRWMFAQALKIWIVDACRRWTLNWNEIVPGITVGSCPRSPSDLVSLPCSASPATPISTSARQEILKCGTTPLPSFHPPSAELPQELQEVRQHGDTFLQCETPPNLPSAEPLQQLLKVCQQGKTLMPRGTTPPPPPPPRLAGPSFQGWAIRLSLIP